ncbi:MAG: AAA family ATPase [Deltaproteobacteria bacterium]|nr:AAA family ATPase [Deltaproteobacteria bacterium]
MNLPSELILERFRSFASATTLPLSPITLVYGANNSGKSSLLRALALVGAALEPDASSPAPLPEAVFPNGQFGFLAWQGRRQLKAGASGCGGLRARCGRRGSP